MIQLGDFFPVKILAHLHTLYYRDFYRCWLAATMSYIFVGILIMSGEYSINFIKK
jgi:hypothetical protein